MSPQTSHKSVAKGLAAALFVACMCLMSFAVTAGAQGVHRTVAHRSQHGHSSVSHRSPSARGRVNTAVDSVVSPLSFTALSMHPSDAGNVRLSHDRYAFEGRALLITSDDTVSKSVAVDGTISQVAVRARGDQCNGAPKMTVQVAGHTVLATDVSNTTWHTFTASASIAAGTHVVSITFPNDYMNRSCDRNLRLEVVTITVTPPAPKPEPAPAPTETTPTTTTPAPTTTETTPTPPPTTTETTPTPTTPETTPPLAPESSGTTIGMVSGAGLVTDSHLAGQLGASYVRVEFDITTAPSQIQPTIERYAANGARVLLMAGFYGRIPSSAEAQNLATWAHAFGPGGTFWAGRSDGNLAVRQIEFGNETNQSYQFNGCSWNCPEYIPRAENYARALKTAQVAIGSSSGDAGVGLLAIADDGGTGSANWVNGMFHAVPDLGSRVVGWTAHSYGPQSHWQMQLNHLISWTQADGAPSTVPIYITEFGFSSANGTCLNNNYGWNLCMTYDEAASRLHEDVGAFLNTYGSRIRALMIYQVRDQQPLGTTNSEYYFGALTSTGGEKGAYTTEVRSLLASHKA